MMSHAELSAEIEALTEAIATDHAWNRDCCLPHQAPRSLADLEDLRFALTRARALLEAGKAIPAGLQERIDQWRATR